MPRMLGWAHLDRRTSWSLLPRFSIQEPMASSAPMYTLARSIAFTPRVWMPSKRASLSCFGTEVMEAVPKKILDTGLSTYCIPLYFISAMYKPPDIRLYIKIIQNLNVFFLGIAQKIEGVFSGNNRKNWMCACLDRITCACTWLRALSRSWL